jgi:D-alanyl-lipoteichoic acid acyltransferase DltB (MBOAT superfamily)
MDAPRRRVASLSALGGGIGALAVDVLYLNLIIQQRATPPGGRVPLIAFWIAGAAVLALLGAVAVEPRRRAWLLGWSAAALFVLGLFALFSFGIALLVCAIAIGLGALGAAEMLAMPRWVAFLAPIGFVAAAGAGLLLGFLATAP